RGRRLRGEAPRRTWAESVADPPRGPPPRASGSPGLGRLAGRGEADPHAMGPPRTRLLVDHPERAGEEPGEALAEAVAPVLPVVAVAGLDVADLHAGLLEEGEQAAVLVDEGLVDAAGEEEALRGAPGRGAEGVHEVDDGLEERAAAAGADVGE